MSQYIQVTEQFTTDNNYYTNEPNILHIVQTLSKRYVTADNSYNEFPTLFQLKYDFVVVNESFYNQYNNTSPTLGSDPLFVRKTNDNKYVVEIKMRQYFSHLFTLNEPVVQYTMMDFQDTYLTLSYNDFDHSNDII